jgi:SAM-dependent methyltransferase
MWTCGTMTSLKRLASIPVVVFAALVACSPGKPPSQADVPYKISLSYDEARAVLDAHQADLPVSLRGRDPAAQAAAWPGWVAEHDAGIRARLAHGDEDSILNLWLYGTSFTGLPRATTRDLAAAKSNASKLLEGRLNDLIEAAASPGKNERLQFVRQVLVSRGIDPSTDAGQNEAWTYLSGIRDRVNREALAIEQRARVGRGAAVSPSTLASLSTLFRDRGLSSDTSILVDFGLDQLLTAMKAAGQLRPGQIHRVAIVGPGLDFTDKAEGYDFYPLQTIQPFALADSLTRLQLAAPDLTMATFDVSLRVNAHLAAARERGRAGTPYVIQLPLDPSRAGRVWTPELERYWTEVGSAFDAHVAAIPPPAELSNVRVRAVQVPASVAGSLVPFDLDIVVEHLNPAAGERPFDLIVATNVLLYYDAFEQALALRNISAMLRPGGYLLTNTPVSPPPPFNAEALQSAFVSFDDQHNGDNLFAYALHER